MKNFWRKFKWLFTLNKKIEWDAIDDGWQGYCVVGYGWTCPLCNHYEMFGDYWEDKVTCTACKAVFKNTDKPQD